MKKLFLPFVFLSLASVSVLANTTQKTPANTKDNKQTSVKKTSTADDDEYYLEPVNSQKETTTPNTSNQDDDEYYLDATQQSAAPNASKRKLPPTLLVNQQQHQLDKLSQSRDNPKPKHYWKDKLGAAALLDVDLTDATHPEFTHSRDDDISIPNIKVNLDGKLDPCLSGHIGLFWSTNADRFYPEVSGHQKRNVQFDEGFVTIKNFKAAPLYLQAGRQYLPFGSYHRFPILKPLTQKLSELREDSVQLGFIRKNNFYGAVYGFQGLSNTSSKHKANYGAMFGYSNISESTAFDFGVGFLRNMIDVGAIRYGLPSHHYHTRVGAISSHIDLYTGPFSFAVRYVSALRNFSANDYAWQRKPGSIRGGKPRAMSLIAGYTFKTAQRESRIDIGYQWSKEGHNVNNAQDNLSQLPKNRISASYAVYLWKNIIVAFEYDHDHDYSKANGGTNRFNNTATIRLTALI